MLCREIFRGGPRMKLKCLLNISRFTTKDKEYPVIKETECYCTIKADDGYPIEISKFSIGKFFEVVEE